MEVSLKYFINESTENSRDAKFEIIKNVGIGKNETKMIQFDDGKIGFLKNSSKTTTAILDNLEYFISTLGKHILNISVANIYKAFDEQGFVGTISENVAGKNETLIMLSEIIDTLLEINSPEVKDLANTIVGIREKNTKRFQKKDGMILERPVLTEEADICQIVDMFPLALDLINVPSDQRKAIKKDYFKMIIFDILTNQVDRNNNNYGIVHNKKNGHTRFSELFDNSTIYIPGLPQTHHNLNGFLIERTALINCLISNYGEDVNDIISHLIEKKDGIIEKTQSLAQKTLSPNEQQMFLPLFVTNINNLCEITNEKRTTSMK